MKINNAGIIQQLILIMYYIIPVRGLGIMQIAVHLEIAPGHVIIVEKRATCNAHALNNKKMRNLIKGSKDFRRGLA